MIRISIDGVERTLEQASQSWLRDEIETRRKSGRSVCVRVTINSGALNMVLTTPACSGGGGGGRPPTPEEKRIFDLWAKREMNTNDFVVGQLNAFLNEVKHA
jgi:hypothetical protein